MLRRFLYLDERALADYASVVDGGLLTESTRAESTSRSGGAGADLKIAKGQFARESGGESGWTYKDTPASSFERLARAAEADPDALGWIEVMEPDTDFASARTGTFVSWECELEVPQTAVYLARKGGLADAVDTARALLPVVEQFGGMPDGLPSLDQLDAIKSFTEGMNASLIVNGVDDETPWTVSTVLLGEHDPADFQGRAIVVGKVIRTLREDEWKPYLAFPGLGALTREKRRELERQKPTPGKEGEFLGGPALLLDVLAIYR